MKDPNIVEAKFDVITCFRFFLNAQQELCDEALSFLVSKLRSEESILVFNTHGNKHSTRWFMPALHKIFIGKYKDGINQLSINKIKLMVSRHNLEIKEYYSVGILDKSFYDYMPK